MSQWVKAALNSLFRKKSYSLERGGNRYKASYCHSCWCSVPSVAPKDSGAYIMHMYTPKRNLVRTHQAHALSLLFLTAQKWQHFGQQAMHGEAPFEAKIPRLSCPCTDVHIHQMLSFPLLSVELERTWAGLCLGAYFRVNFTLVGFLSFWEKIWLHGRFGTLGTKKIKGHRILKVTAFAWEDGAPTPLAFLVL